MAPGKITYDNYKLSIKDIKKEYKNLKFNKREYNLKVEYMFCKHKVIGSNPIISIFNFFSSWI